MKRNVFKILKSARGFTLIELMVVLAVMGILFAIAIPQYTHFQASGRDARRKSDLHEYNVALQRSYNAHGVYPIGGDGPGNFTDVTAPTPTGIFVNPNPLSTDGYLTSPIMDPINLASAGLFYRYLTNNTGSAYVLYARLEAGTTTWWIQSSDGTAQGTNTEPTAP